MEWKVLKISFLDIAPKNVPTRSIYLRKALTLSDMDLAAVLNIKFISYDKFGRGGKTIDEWVWGKDGPADQLKSYWNSPEITGERGTHTYHAYLVVIVGSRKILLWRMRENELIGPDLVCG